MKEKKNVFHFGLDVSNLEENPADKVECFSTPGSQMAGSEDGESDVLECSHSWYQK